MRRVVSWVAAAVLVAAGIGSVGATVLFDSMMKGENGYAVTPIWTVGETFSGASGALNPNTPSDYTPVGVLDGLGAYELDESTVRVFANHELLHFRGSDYPVAGGAFTLSGARISYFDIDKGTRTIVDAGLAYDTIYDANGVAATDASFLPDTFATEFGGSPPGSPLAGFSRFCSSALVEAHQFGTGRGLADTIYFAGEEDGGGFSSVGGAEWALDVATGDLWALPAMGRGAWENITEVDTGTTTHVAFLLADDTSPFDAEDYDADQANGDPTTEAAPLYLYVGEKDPLGDFPARNGLRGGQLYVWVADSGVSSPAGFNTAGKLKGRWVEIDNSPSLADASADGSSGFDEFGYPTQRTLWTRAEALGAFGFSRPEDVATNPNNGRVAVLASTGVDSYEGGVDTFGTLYQVRLSIKAIDKKLANGTPLRTTLKIIYDGDADPARRLRSPDNLDWADDGLIYVQEDEAEEVAPSGEPLFGPGAVNPNEASIVRLKRGGKSPKPGKLLTVATIDRSVVLDPTIPVPTDAVDGDAGSAGEWETSGIVDVSGLFGEAPGTLFLFDVQAHGIEDQEETNPTSRLNDDDLVEGGQLSFLGLE